MIQQRRVMSIPPIFSVRYRAPAAAALSSLLTGLVSYWTLDELNNPRLNGVAGGPTLSDVGGLTTQPGKIGLSVSGFTAAKYLQLSSVLNLTDNWTISFWSYETSNSTQILIAGAGVGTTVARIQRQSATEWRLVNSTNSYVVQFTSVSLSIPNWHHLVFQKVGPRDFRMYADNQVTIYKNREIYDFTVFDVNRIGSLTVGAPYLGYLDELACWNRILTTNELTALYNAGNGITYPFTGT